MAKNDDQQKLISFRVDDAIFSKFEAMRERFSVGDKKTSTSDMARRLFETASVQNGEFGELLANETESIKQIQRLALSKQPLRKAQWEFLSYLIHQAYIKNTNTTVQSKYFKVILKAFLAWRLISKENDDRYFLGNLGGNSEGGIIARVNQLIDEMPNFIGNAQAEFGTRNFNVAMRDFIRNMDSFELNEALLPLLTQLLPVAIRANFQRTQKPLREVTQDFLRHPIKPINTEHYWLSIIVSGTSFTAGLDLTTHRSVHPINSFMQYQEFAKILEAGAENSYSQSENYWLIAPTSVTESYYLRYKGHQMEFSKDEFEELRSVFRNASEHSDVKSAVLSMIELYGDI